MFRRLSTVSVLLAAILLCILLVSFGLEQGSLMLLDNNSDNTEWVAEESTGEGQKDAETNVETTDDGATRDARCVTLLGLRKRLKPLTWRVSAVHTAYWLRYCSSMAENTWRGYAELVLDMAIWQKPVYLLLHKLTYYF